MKYSNVKIVFFVQISNYIMGENYQHARFFELLLTRPNFYNINMKVFPRNKAKSDKILRLISSS